MGSFLRNINYGMIKTFLGSLGERCEGKSGLARDGVPFDGFNCHFGRRSDIWFVVQEEAFLV